ncbi:MAG: hypothetical protein LBK01_05385 [Burkholderiaceae bacterium]|jgi:hypothetical protein|nr:hypothetical protein [Burkholderiaceae bacterium]
MTDYYAPEKGILFQADQGNFEMNARVATTTAGAVTENLMGLFWTATAVSVAASISAAFTVNAGLRSELAGYKTMLHGPKVESLGSAVQALGANVGVHGAAVQEAGNRDEVLGLDVGVDGNRGENAVQHGAAGGEVNAANGGAQEVVGNALDVQGDEGEVVAQGNAIMATHAQVSTDLMQVLGDLTKLEEVMASNAASATRLVTALLEKAAIIQR